MKFNITKSLIKKVLWPFLMGFTVVIFTLSKEFYIHTQQIKYNTQTISDNADKIKNLQYNIVTRTSFNDYIKRKDNEYHKQIDINYHIFSQLNLLKGELNDNDKPYT